MFGEGFVEEEEWGRADGRGGVGSRGLGRLEILVVIALTNKRVLK